eukprot:CAMPEP_0176052312 /NCGR_PEP_ID=MMETSP0120_2-20121206/26009_1 /TAXON_ID=160619 /ORGANISM="Kryptoperidinium foliaceum, Strain CCMP 1326" /LENGTH=298 /DNA_ID=CAMNT_0017385751 /DNA_START=221 /DNA_END=1117 /DNA_ORIENTATION=-
MPALDLEQQLNGAEHEPHERKQQVSQDTVDAGRPDRPRALVPRDERLPEAGEEDVLVWDDPEQLQRRAPMRATEQQRGRRAGDLGGVERDVDCGLRASDDKHLLALRDFGCQILRRVDDRAVEFALLYGPRRHEDLLAVHPVRNDREVELLRAALPELKDPPLLPAPLLQADDRRVQADVREQLVVVRVGASVLEGLPAVGKHAPRHGLEREVGKLVLLPGHLDAIGVVVLPPEPADAWRLLEDRHRVAASEEGPRHLQARNASADDAHRLHVRELAAASDQWLVHLEHALGHSCAVD